MMKQNAKWFGSILAVVAAAANLNAAAASMGMENVQSTLQQLALIWSESAHNMLLEYAFNNPFRYQDKKVSSACLAKMKEGSKVADGSSYQKERYSYMHAMRAPNQTAERAGELMRSYISAEYAAARSFRDTDPLESCLHRGKALHPIMDSTSPVHERFKVWDSPIEDENGNRALEISKVAGLLGHVALPGCPSHEDPYTLDDHPQLLEITARLMWDVDAEEFGEE